MLMENEDASLTVTTRGEDAPEDYESRSDGTVCESGWGVSSSGELQLLPCSNRGYCRQRQYVHVVDLFVLVVLLPIPRGIAVR